jgi:hypothetical protein
MKESYVQCQILDYLALNLSAFFTIGTIAADLGLGLHVIVKLSSAHVSVRGPIRNWHART